MTDLGGVAFDDDFEVVDASGPPLVDRGGATVVARHPESLQSRGIAYPTEAPIGMQTLRHYVIGRWGGSDLGILALPPRAVRAGSTPSMHNWGMAWDWRWADPGPGRHAADEVIDFAIAESARLGIQAVHDYVNARYWKNHVGWRTARSSPSTGFGQPWSQWLHIERTWDEANSPKPIDVNAKATAAPPTAPPAAADAPGFQGHLPTGPLRRGDDGADVARMQDFLRSHGFADFTISDGEFGPRTDAAVRAAQTALAAKGLYTFAVDGVLGPRHCRRGHPVWRAVAMSITRPDTVVTDDADSSSPTVEAGSKRSRRHRAAATHRDHDHPRQPGRCRLPVDDRWISRISSSAARNDSLIASSTDCFHRGPKSVCSRPRWARPSSSSPIPTSTPNRPAVTSSASVRSSICSANSSRTACAKHWWSVASTSIAATCPVAVARRSRLVCRAR